MNTAIEVIAGVFGVYLLINIVGGYLFDRYFGDGSIGRYDNEKPRVEPAFYDRHEPK